MMISIPRVVPLFTLLLALPLSLQTHAATPRYNPFSQLGNNVGSSQFAASASTLQLRGIITGSRGSVANINGTILSVGESFRGYKLLSADENTANLLGPTGTITLELQQKGDTTNAR